MVLESRKFTAAIDQGTTSTRFFIFDERGEPVAKHQEEFDQIYPHSGWVEHDPFVLTKSVENCIEAATAQFIAAGHKTQDICALGITNQRETAIVWDIRSGEALYNAIVWADSRTTHIVRQLKLEDAADKILPKTGLPLSTYPSAVKVKWILEHSRAAREVYEAGYLAFGTVDTWLLYNLAEGCSGEKLHVTDVTNASRTMFLDINTLEYDPFLIRFFGLEKLLLPAIASSSNSKAYGVLAKGPLKGVRVTGCLGDQSAALVGQKAFEQGMAKNTYGTGCFMLYNTGNQPVRSKNGLLTTVAFQFENQPPVYALEGSIAVAGSAVKFLRDNLGIIREANEIGELAMSVQDSGGVVFVTAFAGLFAPYWIDDAQGTIFGITNYTKKEHICRATIEATCFQTKAIMDAMEKDSGIAIKNLAVDGGMSNSDECMQLQADIIGVGVDRPAMRETTALGAAIAAGFGVNLWSSFNELDHVNCRNHRKFSAQTSPAQRTKRFRQWERAVVMSKGWLTSEDIDKEYDD
ncbi:Glycerol kinase [Arthrobotrys musiformis]|uniref:glycerol kinase n=1 Tax=Arthrobotrys musiformis TaxID=47236 RepID=A0AAV9VWC7_9PEZI